LCPNNKALFFNLSTIMSLQKPIDDTVIPVKKKDKDKVFPSVRINAKCHCED